MSGERIFRIGPCNLTDTDYGSWEAATCSEFCEAVKAHGAQPSLRAWSSFTNMERSVRGAPYIFTEWGTEDVPVVAAGGHPDDRGRTDHLCQMVHAVFVMTGETHDEANEA